MHMEGLQPGRYITPFIGEEKLFSPAETRLEVDEYGIIAVYSPLFKEPYSIGNISTFTDPRTDAFLHATVEFQLHHLDVRQLNLPEHLETRPGAGRYSRLGGVLDSARILQQQQATFEQIVQTLISDFAQPAGSHLRGDMLCGDYAKQINHDKDLWNNIVSSGYYDHLLLKDILDENGYLRGSAYTLYDLANPITPRRFDIVECPRPDPNADRLEFTIHEGVLIHDRNEVQEILRYVTRVETAEGERMALTSPEAARLLYVLAVRHQSEHWGEPMHRVVDELLLQIDRYAAVSDSPVFAEYQQYHPTDYAHTAEHLYYDRLSTFSALDPLVTCLLSLAHTIAHEQRELAYHGHDDHAYTGPVLPAKAKLASAGRSKNHIVVENDELHIRLKAPKYRGPIDALVVSAKGLQRVSEIIPELRVYEQQRKQWVGSLQFSMQLPHAVLKEIKRSESIINRTWGLRGEAAKQKSPLFRPRMPKEILSSNITLARKAVAAHRIVA